MPPLIIPDTNILAPLIKRAVIEALAERGLLALRVTPKILAEAEHTLTRLSEETARRGREDLARWRKVYPDWIMEPAPQAETNLPDPDDQHIMDAAITAGAQTIVTENLRDFPAKQLSPLGLRAVSTDRFLSERMASHPDETRAALLSLPQRVKADFLTPETLLPVLRRAGLKRVVKQMAADHA